MKTKLINELKEVWVWAHGIATCDSISNVNRKMWKCVYYSLGVKQNLLSLSWLLMVYKVKEHALPFLASSSSKLVNHNHHKINPLFIAVNHDS